MYKKILIIGKGSAGHNHQNILKSLLKNKKILIISSRELNFFKNKQLLKKILDFKPSNIILCAPSSYHFKYLKSIENYFSNIDILIEKPLFNKYYPIQKKLKNNYYVGFNLRYHPIIKFIKKFLTSNRPIFIDIISSSYLPNWRKEKNYKKTVSAQKKLGGGVILELSHEIDILSWFYKEIKFTHVLNKKISKLKINCDDILLASGKINQSSYFNLRLNFFSHISERKIKIDGDKFTIMCDLLKNKVIFKNKNKKITKLFNFNIKQSYIEQYKDLFNSKKNICKLKEAIKVQKLIEQISRKR